MKLPIVILSLLSFHLSAQETGNTIRSDMADNTQLLIPASSAITTAAQRLNENGEPEEPEEPPFTWSSSGSGNRNDENTELTQAFAWDGDINTSTELLKAWIRNSSISVSLRAKEPITGDVSISLETLIGNGYGNRGRLVIGCTDTSGNFVRSFDNSNFYSNSNWSPRTFTYNYTNCEYIYIKMGDLGKGSVHFKIAEISTP